MKQDTQNAKDRPIDISVPGRLCLFGEHSDWAADYGIHRGFCLVIGTNQAITAVVRASDRFTVETILPDDLARTSGRTLRMSCPWKAETLLAAAKDETEFFRYTAGAAYAILTQLNVPHGIDIRITRMDLPLKKGVSSSAAQQLDANGNIRKMGHRFEHCLAGRQNRSGHYRQRRILRAIDANTARKPHGSIDVKYIHTLFSLKDQPLFVILGKIPTLTVYMKQHVTVKKKKSRSDFFFC